MTLSRSETILAEIEALLSATDGIGGRVFRDRWEALARNELPAIVLLPLSEDDEITTTTETLTTTLRFSVDILASGEGLSTIADPIRVSAHALLLAAPLTTAGVISLYPQGRQWDAASGEIGVVRSSYAVRYRTLLADLTQ